MSMALGAPGLPSLRLGLRGLSRVPDCWDMRFLSHLSKILLVFSTASNSFASTAVKGLLSVPSSTNGSKSSFYCISAILIVLLEAYDPPALDISS